MSRVAALYVENGGCYFDFGLAVDPWDKARDARRYRGPHPVVAHPPCQRWGRFWHGSTRKPHQYELGDDGGCFEAALDAVRTYGGVLEHPADSRAWAHFGLPIPARGAGWTEPDGFGGRSCYVEQGHYGHASRKPTWLYAVGIDFADLDWSIGEQRLPQSMIDRYGYEKARRIGVVAMVGGKNKTEKRNATPRPFRDVLLGLVQSAWGRCQQKAQAEADEGLASAGDTLKGQAGAVRTRSFPAYFSEKNAAIRLCSGSRTQKPPRPKNGKRAKVKAARKARLRNQGRRP